MTYNPGIPKAKDILADSQGDLLTNFDQLNTIYGTSGDHVAFNAAAGAGKHKKVTFLSQGSDPEMDSPETRENELALFALEDGTDTELYLRKESNGTVNQFTKDGELFLGVHPVFAINLSDLAPDANVGAGTYNFTVNNSFNLDTANTKRLTASRCHYRFFFTNSVLDASGNPTNKYIFTANGFVNSSDPVIGKVPNTAVYDNEVQPNYIDIEFVNQSNKKFSALTGAVIMCWRVQ